MVSSKSRAINLLAVLLISTIVSIISLTALGFFDPIQDGEPVFQKELGTVHIPPNSTEVRQLMDELPSSPLSVRLTAAFESGEMDSSYGLLLGQESDNIAILVSPLGYATVWQQPASSNSEIIDYLLPWQTWPHVHTGGRTNEILVYLDGDTVTVRVNREWLWEEDVIESVERISIIGESYGGETLLNFQLAEISAVEAGK